MIHIRMSTLARQERWSLVCTSARFPLCPGRFTSFSATASASVKEMLLAPSSREVAMPPTTPHDARFEDAADVEEGEPPFTDASARPPRVESDRRISFGSHEDVEAAFAIKILFPGRLPLLFVLYTEIEFRV